MEIIAIAAIVAGAMWLERRYNRSEERTRARVRAWAWRVTVWAFALAGAGLALVGLVNLTFGELALGAAIANLPWVVRFMLEEIFPERGRFHH